MILDGRIKVTILGDDGREVILSMLGPGDFFGEMALLDNEPRSATAIAVEDTELAVAAPHRLPDRAHRQPAASALGLINILTPRLRRANQQISTLALLDVYGRVARRHRGHGARGGPPAEGRPHRLPPRDPPGDREPHRHHARDGDAHAEGPGARGPHPRRGQGDGGARRLREGVRRGPDEPRSGRRDTR